MMDDTFQYFDGRRMMNLRSLRVFTGLVEDGTLTGAARAMNLSQSAASRLLSILEAELGTPLFTREKRGMVPLPAAEALYPEALRILGQVAALPGVASDPGRAPPLRIICQTRLIPGLAIPAVARLFATSPGLPIRLETASRRDLSRRLASGRHDIAIATLPLETPGADVTVLGTAPLQVVLPVDHPLVGAGRIATADLLGMPYIALDQTTIIRRAVDAQLGGTTLPVTVEVSSGAAAYRLVASGIGFTFADEIAIQPELRGRLALVPWEASVEVRIGMAVLRRPAPDGAAALEAALTAIVVERLAVRSPG